MLGRRIGLVLVGLGLIGCGSSPTSLPPSVTVPPAVTAGTSAALSITAVPRRFVGDLVEFTYPGGWNARAGSINPSGNFAIVYVGPQVLPSDCTTPANGVTDCGPWPFMHLATDATVVAWRFVGMPGATPPIGGTLARVGGQSAQRTQGPADPGCAALGGDESIGVVVAHPPRWNGWLEVDACLAGPDRGPGETAFGAMLASAAFP